MSSLFAVGSAVTSALDRIEDLSESKTHHVYHWSVLVYMGGAAIGTIIAIAGFILGQYAIAIAGVLLAGTNALASFYIHRFYVLNKLEDYNLSLFRRNQEQGRQINQLETTIVQLREIEKGYTQAQARHEELLLEQKQNNKELLFKIDALSSELSAANDMIDNIHKEFGSLAQNVESFAKENAIFRSCLSDLEVAQGSLREARQDLSDERKGFERENERYQQLNRVFRDYLKAWKATLRYIQKVEENKEKPLGNAVAAVQSLIPVIQQREKNGNELNRTADQLEEKAIELQGLLLNLPDYLQLMKIKEQPEKWQEFKKLVEE